MFDDVGFSWFQLVDSDLFEAMLGWVMLTEVMRGCKKLERLSQRKVSCSIFVSKESSRPLQSDQLIQV
jgi:hypothetical protein